MMVVDVLVERKRHALEFSVTRIVSAFDIAGNFKNLDVERLRVMGLSLQWTLKQVSKQFKKLGRVMVDIAGPSFRFFSPFIFKTKLLSMSMFTRYKETQSWLSRIHLDVGRSNPQRSSFLSL